MIGPLVVAGVVVDREDEKKFVQLGVKDSKQLSPKKREELAPKIEELCSSVIVMRVPACKIDTYRKKKVNLDHIEAIKMAEIIDIAQAETFYIDSLGTNPKRFQNMILEYARNKDQGMVVENYADETYPVVSAASIIAKVERDKAIQDIKEKVNYDFGVGYSHDARTIKFVEMLLEKKEPLPSFVRQSWITTQVLKEKSLQQKVKDFFKKKDDYKEETNEN